MLNMSSFPSMAAICTSEDFSIVIQNHILCYFPSKFSLSLHCKNAYKEGFVYSLFQALSQGCSPPLSLCIFCPLPVCLNLHLVSRHLFGSSLRQEPNLLSRCIQHLDPCPWLMLTLHTSNSIWYFLILSPFLKRGVRLVFYKVCLLGYLFCMLLQLWHKSSGPVTGGFT